MAQCKTCGGTGSFKCNKCDGLGHVAGPDFQERGHAHPAVVLASLLVRTAKDLAFNLAHKYIPIHTSVFVL